MSTAPKTKSFFSCCCCAEEEKKEAIIEVPDRRPQPLRKSYIMQQSQNHQSAAALCTSRNLTPSSDSLTRALTRNDPSPLYRHIEYQSYDH